MKRKALLVLFILAVLVVIGVVFVLPMIDGEMMKVPLADGIMALRNGDFRSLRGYFTSDATLAYAQTTVSVDAALAAAQPYMAARQFDVSMHFGGYTNLRRESAQCVSADFTVIVFDTSEDNPYSRVPIEKTGHVVLEKQGFMHWEIERLSSTEPEFGEIVQESHQP